MYFDEFFYKYNFYYILFLILIETNINIYLIIYGVQGNNKGFILGNIFE
jgi:hypothetical protein